VGVNAGTWLRLALYSDNGGVVNDVLAQGTVTPAASTWKAVTGLNVEVTEGTYYWLGARLDGCFTYDAGNRAYVAYPGNNAFTNDPAGLTYDNNAIISMYADGTEITHVTVNAVAMTADAAHPTPAIYISSGEVLAPLMTASAAQLAPSSINGNAEIEIVTMTVAAACPTPTVTAVQAQAEATLVGERLEVIHDPAVTSATIAGYVAIAVLAKARLDGKKGQITVPPHCGLELWDVVSVFDNAANQNINYRVCGYTFEYDTGKAQYVHRLDLCAV
jgi:TusA-related sulfurtransferase